MTEVDEDERLDLTLVRRGLAPSRTRAAELLAAGRVRVDGTVDRRTSRRVGREVDVEVDLDHAYVSRGALKLRGAVEDARALRPGVLDLRGRACLDAGASTGGFTQVMLELGARSVVAVDVGHGQLAPTVREDPRVRVVEGFNLRDLGPADLPERPAVVAADLSFISLTLVVGALVAAAAADADLLLLVKPQFEVGRERLGSGGVVTDAVLREEAVLGVAAAAAEHGARVEAVLPSRLPGERGNREVFLWLSTAASDVDGADAVARAVRDGVRAHRPVLVEHAAGEDAR